jgi:hypothetical protein
VLLHGQHDPGDILHRASSDRAHLGGGAVRRNRLSER